MYLKHREMSMAKIKRKVKFSKKQRAERDQTFLNQLYAQRDNISATLGVRSAQGDFDTNARAIRETLEATLDILNYLIELRERDARKKR
jgi:hypothetical protein